MSGPRWIAAAAVAALFAGCTVVPPAQPTPGPSQVVQPIPTPAPAATSAPTPTPFPAGPTTFLFDGQLTQGGWIRGQVPRGTVSARLAEQALTLAADGRFFAAFDRDAGPSTELVATLADGSTLRSPVAVSPREWNIERVDVARSPGGMTDAFWLIREPELARIEAARIADSATDGWRQDFAWPATGRISGRFGSQRIYRGGEPGSYHSGLDIAPGAGVPFTAPADGVVTLAAYDAFSLEGHLIIIDHGGGLNSAFLHASQIFVTEGQRVSQGDRLGLIGASGRATGPHLHWSLKWHDARLDPLLFLGPMP